MNTVRFLRSFTEKIFFIPARTRRKMMLRRNIVGVFTSEEYENYSKEKKDEKVKKVSKQKQNKVMQVIPEPLTQADSYKSTIPKDLLKLKYKKLRDTPGNALYQMMYNFNNPYNRRKLKLCVLNGTDLINEAIKIDCQIKNIYFNKLALLEKLPLTVVQNTHLTHVPDRLLKSFSSDHSDGLLAVAGIQDVKMRNKLTDKRRADERKNKRTILPVTLVIDSIVDATEMGELLKIAAATDCQQVYVMDGCMDIWGRDVLSVANGSHFKVPIIDNLTWETLDKLTKDQHVFISTRDQRALKFNDFASAEQVKNTLKTSSVISTLKSECSVGTLKDFHEPGTEIPSRNLSTVNLLQPSFLIVGNISENAFHYSSRFTLKKRHCCVLTTNDEPHDERVSQATIILSEIRRQRDLKKAASMKKKRNRNKETKS